MLKATSKKDVLTARPQQYCLPAAVQWRPDTELKLERTHNPLPRGTLGDIGLATKVNGPVDFPLTILIQQFDRQALAAIDPASVRVFRWDSKSRTLRPIWNSGINVTLGYVWAKIRRPGVYVPIGLPRDRLLQEALRSMASKRRYADTDAAEEMQAITRQELALFLEAPPEDLDELRRLLASVEVQTSAKPTPAGNGHQNGRTMQMQQAREQALQGNGHQADGQQQKPVARGHGAHTRSFPLPGATTTTAFRDRLTQLETPPGGLPEEALFYKPELLSKAEPRWPLPAQAAIPRLDPALLSKLAIWPWLLHFHFNICWFFSNDWPMYHGDPKHSGDAAGCSDITSTSVGGLLPYSTVALDGTIITMPTIVDGKIYIGTSDKPGGGGTLYKIDLYTGAIEATFSVLVRYPAYSQGIGGSPAVVNGRVYVTAIPGMVYCLDASTFALIWQTDLRNADPAHNQPVQNDPADCWSSPLVVNGKVYIGCGEGENGAFGFVYCLDASSGNVIWLFCTNKFTNGADNAPNVIPSSTVGALPLLAGYTQQPNPERGNSVWSSCAYDAKLNRIYVGTGNAASGDFNPLPDVYYGSGVLSLDADTGAFKGFFQPAASANYRPNDTDVDVASSPLLFTLPDGTHAVAIGTKGGAFMLLNADTMAPLAIRQLLPYDASGNPLPNVDPHTLPDENMYGTFGTAAVHHTFGQLYVGVGGYGGAIDTPTTPFMRALDWSTLNDAWFTFPGFDGVSRYILSNPPMYTTPGEVGLSSPAVVNDVVFVSTAKPGLYALDAPTGLCLWSAPNLTPSGSPYILGPAIYGDYVVIGGSNQLHIYAL